MAEPVEVRQSVVFAFMPRPLALLLGSVMLFFYVDGFVLGAPLPQRLLFSLLGGAVLTGFLEHAEHGAAGAVRAEPALFAGLAAMAVLGLSRGAMSSVVLAASLVGTAGGLLERYGRLASRWQGMAVAVYCGAFAGMTSELVLAHPAWVLLAGVMAGLLLSLFHHCWGGIGGKLGTTAFIGVVAACGLAHASGAMGQGLVPHVFNHAERIAVVLLALASPLVTHQLSYRLGWGPVLGSALPSLMMVLPLERLLPLLPLPWQLAPVPLAATWLGASFVGMSAPERLCGGVPLLLAMGLVFAGLSQSFEPMLAGIGGDLGAMAAVAVLAVLGLQTLIRQARPTSRR